MSFRQQKKQRGEVSMSDAIDFDRDGNPLTYEDVISTDENMAEELDRRLMGERAMHYVRKCLTPRERQVIVLRYGLGGAEPLTQREAANRLGISRSYVSRIEKAALEKLAEAFGTGKG